MARIDDLYAERERMEDFIRAIPGGNAKFEDFKGWVEVNEAIEIELVPVYDIDIILYRAHLERQRHCEPQTAGQATWEFPYSASDINWKPEQTKYVKLSPENRRDFEIHRNGKIRYYHSVKYYGRVEQMTHPVMFSGGLRAMKVGF